MDDIEEKLTKKLADLSRLAVAISNRSAPVIMMSALLQESVRLNQEMGRTILDLLEHKSGKKQDVKPAGGEVSRET